MRICMKKYAETFLICFLLLTVLALIGCEGKQGKLIVDAKPIDSEYVVIYNEYDFELPFIASLQAIGCHIQWTDEKSAIVTWEGQDYALNISEEEKYFAKVGDNTVNYLLPAPGSKNYYFKSIEKEAIIDDGTFDLIMHMMEIEANIYADCSSMTAYVEILHTAEEE